MNIFESYMYGNPLICGANSAAISCIVLRSTSGHNLLYTGMALPDTALGLLHKINTDLGHSEFKNWTTSLKIAY
jgi:hypothetical protein